MREYFRDCQEHLAKSNLPLSWINPTGLPISNRYFKPNIETVNIYRNGRRLRFDVAEGELPIIDQNGALDSVSPNVVHSMDAAHVVRVVLRAAEEGIRDVLTEHDSYSCLAPQATQFNQLIRRELALLYHCYNLLAVLRRAAGLKWQPNLGELDPLEVQNAEWCWI
jgi:DNA-directed RNA polymerase